MLHISKGDGINIHQQVNTGSPHLLLIHLWQRYIHHRLYIYWQRILQANKIIFCIINVFVFHMQIAIAFARTELG